MSLLSRLRSAGASGFGYGSTAAQAVDGLDLSGKTILLTGCNAGIGLETMRALTGRGARVIAAARTVEKAANAAKATGGDVVPVACELSEPASVLQCVQSVSELGPLHAIICNAGVMALPTLELKHGLEMQFFTNHIGHFLLVTSLLDQLADDGRVVMVSSNAHRRTYSEGIQFDNLNGAKGYTPFGAYGQSKLSNLLFARELARRFDGSSRTAVALHPGVIHTGLAKHMGGAVNFALAVGGKLALKSPQQGAATQTWAAVHPDAAAVSGEYLSDCNVAESTQHGRDRELASRLWEVSEEIVAEFT